MNIPDLQYLQCKIATETVLAAYQEGLTALLEEVERYSRLACTPEERAVLDAMARWTDTQLRYELRWGGCHEATARAELARRTAKKAITP